MASTTKMMELAVNVCICVSVCVCMYVCQHISLKDKHLQIKIVLKPLERKNREGSVLNPKKSTKEIKKSNRVTRCYKIKL